MELTHVRIVTAGPFRVAAFSAEGTEPEAPAFEKLKAWAEPRGLLADPAAAFLFGRNDPPPMPGRTDYGYVYMLTVPDDVDPGDGAEFEVLPRATYLVVRARLPEMGAAWEALYHRAESSGFTVTDHGVEEHLDIPGTVAPEEMVFDLWLPVDGAEHARA
ncbi:MAG: GyrI-like domain-containing protein [Candidatus Eisenbacteria bacterium]|nr:GyrI-like domain-containing protein [Candidatus Eisenbacteria bacterium]